MKFVKQFFKGQKNPFIHSFIQLTLGRPLEQFTRFILRTSPALEV